MVEMTFGSGSPMWTPMPSVGMPYPLMGLGGFPVSTSAFGAPFLPGGGGAISAPAAPVSSGLSTAVPVYNGSGFSGAHANLAGAGFAAPHPFASSSWASQMAGAAGVVTASSILEAVALRRGQPQGPASDADVEDFIYDALELLPGAADVEIRCEGGRVTLTGSVQHKRTKHDIGEIAWAVPVLHDVQNNVSITSRRRGRATNRETETPANVPARKQG